MYHALVNVSRSASFFTEVESSDGYVSASPVDFFPSHGEVVRCRSLERQLRGDMMRRIAAPERIARL